jgi:hypothetical protein
VPDPGRTLIDAISPEPAPRRRTWWSLAALALVVIGVVLVILGLRGPDVGPGIPGPIGVTSAVVATTHELRAAPGESVVTSPGPGGASSTGRQTSPQPAAASATKNSLTSSKTTTGATSSSRPVARAIDESRPVHLSIPDIGLSEPVSELGLNTNGTVQAPTSWMVPGWYKFGPSPGER